MQRAASALEIDPVIESLLERHEERLVFVHPAWLRTWLAEFGDRYEPALLRCQDDGGTGVAPLMRDDDRLTFIGDPSICDFMDVALPPDPSPDTYDALWRRLCREEWRELDLWGLRAASPTREAIATRATEDGYEAIIEHEAVAPRVRLPGTWDEYLASLSKKDRHELRRKMRRLYDGGARVDLHVYSHQTEVMRAMDVFFDLHRRSRMDKTEFMTPEMTSFFRRMASAMSAEDLVRLFVMHLDGQPVASVFCFDAGSCLYMYNSGYDPEFSSLSVGLVSKALCLKWAIENGKRGLDFLRGNEAYKYDFGAVDQEIFRLIVRRPA